MMLKQLTEALFCEDGRLSSTRIWKHIAYAVATYIVVKMGVAVTWEVLALYLAVIAADNRAGAIIRKKYENQSNAPT